MDMLIQLLSNLLISGGFTWEHGVIVLCFFALLWLERKYTASEKRNKEVNDKLVEITKEFADSQNNSAHTVADIATRFTGAIESLIRLTTH